MFEYSSQIKAMGLIHDEHYTEYIQRINIYLFTFTTVNDNKKCVRGSGVFVYEHVQE
jgi:hypothetical protein